MLAHSDTKALPSSAGTCPWMDPGAFPATTHVDHIGSATSLLQESQCCSSHRVCFNPSASSCLSPPIPPCRSMACALPLQDITGSRMPPFSSSLKTYDGTFLSNQEGCVLVSSSPCGPRPFLHPRSKSCFFFAYFICSGALILSMGIGSYGLAICIGTRVVWITQDGPFLIRDHATEHLEALHGRDGFIPSNPLLASWVLSRSFDFFASASARSLNT